ncbi:hypothetical protein [Planomicrobium sp. CPCC 101079]|uniref:hypothetical protein n=1 Tax=Planomicrobium sp. CPCC 101079 TaxID=2599618 RepID=UPI0011B556D2|nr:hypothetical protein [Planomicrobium sp. CPCC 101079]TWT13174.1 hypothetical protein FQV28_03285 [Planomicrobium sp. CPCC 101079]
MDKFDHEVREQLKSFLQEKIQFTSEEKEQVHERILSKKSKGFQFNPVYWSVLTAAIALSLFFSFFYLTDFMKNPSSNEQTGSVNGGIVDTMGEQKEVYSGKPLHIAVIGEIPIVTSGQVTFNQVESEALKNNLQAYDAFFVTDEHFEELATDEWTDTFERMPVPVFFIGLDVQAFIFHENDLDYKSHKYEANSHTQGFVGEKAGGKSWEYGDPIESTNPGDTPKEIFALIFEDIEEFQTNKKE